MPSVIRLRVPTKVLTAPNVPILFARYHSLLRPLPGNLGVIFDSALIVKRSFRAGQMWTSHEMGRGPSFFFLLSSGLYSEFRLAVK